MKSLAKKFRKKHGHSSDNSIEKSCKKTTTVEESLHKQNSEENKSSFIDVNANCSPTTNQKTKNILSGKVVFSMSPKNTRKNPGSNPVSATSSPVLNRFPRSNSLAAGHGKGLATETSFSSLPTLPPSTSFDKDLESPSSMNSFAEYTPSVSGDNLAGSFDSLSLESSPCASALSLSTTSNQFHLSLTDNQLNDLKKTKKTIEISPKSPSGVWKKHFKFPFLRKEQRNPHYDAKRRSSNAELYKIEKTVKQRRSQSLCVGNLEQANEILEKFRQDNEALELEVRGKDEELRLLNATMDQANQTWEEKVQSVIKDLEVVKRKNEQLRHIISKDAATAQATANKPAVRVPLSSEDRPGRLPSLPEAEDHNCTYDDSAKALGSNILTRATPPTKKRGIREAPKKMVISVRPSAKTDDVKQKLLSALSKSKCLSLLSRDELNAIVDIMKCKRINKGERLMQEGHVGQSFYILSEGDCRIYKQDQVSTSPKMSDAGRPVAQWELFGEADVFYHTRRVWSCKCVQQGTVWYITRDQFKSAVMQQDIRQRKREVHNFLRNVKRFQNLKLNHLRMLSTVSRIVQYAHGDYIIRQGASSKCAYVIKEGEVTLTRLIDGTETRQQTLKAGELFGETGTANRYKMNIVASGKEVVQCILIPLKHFDLIRDHVASSTDEVTANKINESLAERIDLKDGQESVYSDFTMNSSSGYGSDTSTVEKAKIVHKKRYNSRHTDVFTEKERELTGVGRDDFEFIATIGNGAFGSVDLVSTKKDSNRLVAVKKISKHEIVASEQQQNVFSEKNLQMSASRDCPFIASLYATFKDNRFVYFVMEYCAGGELFSLLTHAGSFNDVTARFYAGCILEALHFLHSRHILFRDLKPENVVIDKNGYCKLTDFGFAKKVSAKSSLRTYTYCGTPEYMAPEVLLYHAQSFAVDLWSFGVFIFEMLDGKAPFRNKNRAVLAETILRGIEPKLQVAREANRISSTAASLIHDLCQILPEDRLGSGKNGISDVSRHPWFHKINWEALRQKRMRPPWTPKLESAHDLRYFDTTTKPNTKLEQKEEFSGWDENF